MERVQIGKKGGWIQIRVPREREKKIDGIVVWVEKKKRKK